MHKNTLWLIFAILCIYFSLVFCKEYTQELQEARDLKDLKDLLRSDTTALEEEARFRKRHRHHLYSLWGFYGLAIAYLIKIKVVVVAFFVGSAIYLGLRYLWPHKCAGVGGEIYKEGSIVLDHPPSFAHHDHIPYSLDHDHHYDSGSFSSSGPTSFEPYSAYENPVLSGSDNSFPYTSYTESDGHPESLTSNVPSSYRRKRSDPKTQSPQQKEVIGTLERNLARQLVVNEEQIGEFMLNFLGLDTNGCRRRFICEMEFKSKLNPLTSMAFRIIGRSFFGKYTNNQNPLRQATSFADCAAVNAECVFIENENEEAEAAEEEEEEIIQHEEYNSVLEEQVATHNIQKEATKEKNSLESNDFIEKDNENNLQTELKRNSYRTHLREKRNLKLI